MNSVLRAVYVFFILAAVCAAQVNVLTANYDTDRTSSNNNERLLSPSSVNAINFGKVGAFPVDGEIYAQPLYVSGVSIAGKLHNVVYTVTMHDSVYAFDADALTSSVPLWQVSLGTSVPAVMLNFNDVDLEVGILGTPVIDLGRQAIYVVSDTLENGQPTFSLHALSLVDGHEIAGGPVVIAASVAGYGDGGETVEFVAGDLLQRPGLALLNENLYIAFGSHADNEPWHGWMVAYNTNNLHQSAVLCTTPNGMGSSIWQSGRAPAIDLGGGPKVTRGAGRAPVIQNEASLYVATGNGQWDGMTNFGESILRLSPTNLSVIDWYTPDNWADLDDNDWDLGSSGVILVPGTNLLVTAGKSGNVYLAPRTPMGHLTSNSSSATQSFNVNMNGIWDTALWNNQSGPTVFVAEAYGGPLDAFRIANGAVNQQIQSQTTPFPTYYAGIAISSDGGKDGSGIVWLATEDTSQTPAPGVLSAFDANDLTQLLWDSTTLAERDAPGSFAKFATPTVANGKVFLPTFSNQLAVYGLVPLSPPTPSKFTTR
jgi:hypothetical protein